MARRADHKPSGGPPAAAGTGASPPPEAPHGAAGGRLSLEGANDAGLAGPSLRGTATLLIALYLAGLALTVAGNTASGTSNLVDGLKTRLFSPWMVPAWLDLGFDTRLTYGLPEDGDHHLEVSTVGAAPRVLRLPGAGERSERASRWRRMARAAALAEEGDEQAGVLPAAIGAGVFTLAGGSDLMVRIVRTVPPDYAAATVAPSGTQMVAEARVRRIDGEVQMIPVKPAEELAPLGDGGRANGESEGRP